MMASRFTQISSVLRIVRGERDALVRTTHFKATVENVSTVTIERKTMSTKTTFKRVALVAVAAMGLGLLSVAPSSATVQVDTLTISSATSATTPTVAATTTVTQSFLGIAGDATTVTASVVSMPAGNIAVPVLTSNPGLDANGSTAISGSGLVGTFSDTSVAYAAAKAVYTATFTPALAGTYVFKFTAANGVVPVLAAPVTWTITVSATNTTVTAANSTSILNAGASIAGVADVAVAATKVVGTGLAGAQAATIVVTPRNSAGTDLTATTQLTVSISGPGTLGIGAGASGNSIGRSIIGVLGDNTIGVYSDGNAGSGVVTISAGTTVLATETVTFFGTATTLTATVIDSVIADGVANAAVLVVAKDALGFVVPTQALTVTSSNTAVIASGTTTSATAVVAAAGTAGTVTVTPVAASHGSVTLTFSDAATTPVIASTTATIIVSSASVATSVPSIAFDKASYLPGEKMTVTLSAVDANGLPVPNTVTAASLLTAAGLTSNVALQGFVSPAGVLTDGKVTAAGYAPLVSGDVAMTGTGANTAATALSATATVAGGDAAAALEAANDAYDAANYAADAADAATTAAEEATAAAVAAGDAATAAQESADAALAAVTDLGLKVTGLISALRAQITSLTNLIVKIQKKVKA